MKLFFENILYKVYEILFLNCTEVKTRVSSSFHSISRMDSYTVELEICFCVLLVDSFLDDQDDDHCSYHFYSVLVAI